MNNDFHLVVIASLENECKVMRLGLLMQKEIFSSDCIVRRDGRRLFKSESQRYLRMYVGMGIGFDCGYTFSSRFSPLYPQ